MCLHLSLYIVGFAIEIFNLTHEKNRFTPKKKKNRNTSQRKKKYHER